MDNVIDPTVAADYSTTTTLTILNLDDCRDYLSLRVGGKVTNIKLVGTHEDPWFCGRDVCEFLSYANSKVTLWTHVKPQYRYTLAELQKEVVHEPYTTFFGRTHMENLTYNDGKVVYINEAGLYSLIMHSRTPMAERFQDLVCGTILPSIRKTGQYRNEARVQELEGRIGSLMLENTDLGRANSTLELEKEELAQGVEELEQKNEELEQDVEELEHKNEELEQDVEDLEHDAEQLTNTIQVVCEERAPLPVTERLRERFVLLQLDDEDKPEHLYVIRGQHQYVERRLRKHFVDNKILLDMSNHPNAITLFTRLKESVPEATISGNTITLNGSDVNEIIDVIVKVNAEKYSVE
jgi:prophage antirepressor-like protein